MVREYKITYTVEPHYNEVRGTMKITLLHMYIRFLIISGYKNKEL